MKKLFSFFALFTVVLFSSLSVNAQTANTYTYSTSTGAALEDMTGSTQLIGTGVDDTPSPLTAFPGGFAFNYEGTFYTDFSVTPDGFCKLGTPVTTAQFSNSITSTTNRPKVFPYWDDLATGSAAGGGNVSYKIFGSSPNRKFVIEWFVTVPRLTSGPANTKFQLWLHENGVIEFVYSTSGGTTTSSSVGINSVAANATNFNCVTISTNTNSTVTANNTNAVYPDPTRVYTFTPPPPPDNDVAVTQNIAPIGAYANGSPAVFPSAKIYNAGTLNQNTPFYTIYDITGPVNYRDSVAEVLNSGQEKTIVMPSSFSLNVNGSYNVTIYSKLPGDQYLPNDTLKSSFSVYTLGPNFGQDSGYFYANNLATNQPSYPRWGWKDTTGSKNLILNSSLQATITGGIDDGYFKLSLSDVLTQFGINPLGQKLKLNGNEYDSLFVNTNGIIGMTEQFGTYSFNDFNIDGAQVPHNAILAFWHDINFGSITGGTNRLSYKAVKSGSNIQIIVTYDRGVSFAPTTDWVSFQVVLEVVNTGGANSNWRTTFADTTNQNTSNSFLANYNAQIASVPPAATVFRNYMMGWTNTGATVYSGYVSSGNPFPASPVTQVNDNSPLFSNGKGLAVEFGPNQNLLNIHDVMVICASISLEGLQSNNRVRDTVTVMLYDVSTNPNTLIQSTKVFLDSVNNGGLKSGRKYISISVLKRGAPVRLAIKHRNSITVYSSNSISTLGDTLKYDFTTAVTQTFGANSVLVNGVASSYTGDINADGVVDVSDVSAIDNDAYNFVSGPYDITDLNWDGVVDVGDAALADNNAYNFVSVVTPPGVVSAFEIPEFHGTYNKSQEIKILPDPYAVPKIDLNAIDNNNIKKED